MASSEMETEPVQKNPNSTSYTEDERNLHEGFMREALAMAELALATDETPVGCVFVYDSKIIGRGMNATNRTLNGTRHAEFVAIASIISSSSTPRENSSQGSSSPIDLPATASGNYSPSIFKECHLYVTVEPCIMCASLLRQYGIKKVFYGASNERFGGTGGVLRIHDDPGVEDGYEASGGWLREEAIMLLRRFYVQENGKAPGPRNKKERKLKTDIEPLANPDNGST